MSFTPDVRRRLGEVFSAPVLKTLERRTVFEPWDEELEKKQKPFHHALVPAGLEGIEVREILCHKSRQHVGGRSHGAQGCCSGLG